MEDTSMSTFRIRSIVTQSIGLVACLLLAALWSSSASAQRIPVPWPQTAVDHREKIRGPESPVIGNADAPITIVSFSDYQCPYCRELSTNLQHLVEEQPDRIRVIYRHFAMTPESHAMAEATLCAADQGRFADYHRLVFGTPGVTVGTLPDLATQLGLNLEEFRACTASNRHAKRVDADIREGERLGIQVTPTFFINGKRVVGSASAEKLRDKIAELVPTVARRQGAR
jgi:protein-disulfide isomerase